MLGVLGEPMLQRRDRVSGSELELEQAQSRGAVRWSARALALPRVQAHVVVIAARRQERGRRHLCLLLQAERIAIERGGAWHVGYLQMHVAERRVRGHRRRRLGRGVRHQGLQIERQRDHLHAGAARGPLPALARAVRIDLNPQPVGIGEVQGLRDAVIRGAVDRPARAGDATNGRGELVA